MSLFNRICGVGDHDSRRDRKAKSCIALCSLTTIFCGVIALALTELEHAAFFVAGVSIAVAASLGILGALHATKAMPTSAIMGYTASLLLCIMLIDYDSLSAMSERKWPLFLLLINMLICCRVHPLFNRAMIALSILWLFFTSLESSYRWGWFDSSGTASFEQRTAHLRCDAPPCDIGLGDGMRGFIVAAIIVGFNCFFTESSTLEVEAGADALSESSATIELVVDALGRFDVDTAERFIVEKDTALLAQGCEATPGAGAAALQQQSRNFHAARRLHHVLGQLVLSLQAYRPHLCDGLFMPQDSGQDSGGMTCASTQQLMPAVSPGKEGGGKDCPHDNTDASGGAAVVKQALAIVFVDVENASSLWRSNSGMMKASVQLYTMCLEALVADFGGTLAKTSDECALVTFPAAADACRFSLALHTELMKQSWPSKLSRYACCRSVSGVWSGLRLKVGVHFGDVVEVKCGVSGASQHRGAAVHKAFLIMKCCVPGSVSVSEDVMSLVRRREFGSDYDGSDFAKIGNPVVIAMGDFHMLHRKFPNEYLTAMLPTNLAGRKQFVVGAIDTRHTRFRDASAPVQPTVTLQSASPEHTDVNPPGEESSKDATAEVVEPKEADNDASSSGQPAAAETDKAGPVPNQGAPETRVRLFEGAPSTADITAADAMLAESDPYYLDAGFHTEHGLLSVFGSGACSSDDDNLLQWIDSCPSAKDGLDLPSRLELLGFGRRLAESSAAPPPDTCDTDDAVVLSISSPRATRPTLKLPQHLKRGKCLTPCATYATVAMQAAAQAGTDPTVTDPFLPGVVEVVLDCTERTDGLAVGMLGGNMHIGWNVAGKGCNGHPQRSVRFAALLRRAVRYGFGSSCSASLGLSCGPLTWGIAGTSCIRFLSVSGQCASLATLLAESALQLQTFCLYASPMPSGPPLHACLHTFLRPVDTWEARSLPNPIAVYEVNADRLITIPIVVMVDDSWSAAVGQEECLPAGGGVLVGGGGGGGKEAGAAEWAWGDEFAQCFASGDHEAIRRRSGEADSVAQQVAVLLQHGTHLRLPMHL